MSELQEHQFCESDEFFREYPGPLSNEMHLYYLKSEADKVIAHNKYKRCLAMAKWCMAEYLHSKCLDFTNTEQWYWRRWHIRWRNLAEKFKEVK